jgi:ATP-dependent Clp protease, protease subunit
MTAIKIHHTPVDKDAAWDGPAEVAKAGNDEKELRYMHAWVDESADPTAKSSYKFPHHAAGTDTPANIHGVDNALARLDQSDIPDADKDGVRAHLNAHRKDAGLDVNDLAGEPIRCFEGSAKPHERFWRWIDAAGKTIPGESGKTDPSTTVEEEPTLELYGVISEYSWFGDEVTPQMFRDDLQKYGKGGPVTVSINSPGGEVIAANVIKTILQDYKGRVTGKIIGMAASAATLVCMGCDLIKMDEGAFFMIHDPGMSFFLDYLNLGQLQGLVAQLVVCKDALLNSYASKTGIGKTRLANMMSAETWMDANQAKDLGFVDEITTGAAKKTKATSLPITNCLKNYAHLPDGLKLIAETIQDKQPFDSQVNGLPPASQGMGLTPDQHVGENHLGEHTEAEQALRLREYLEIFS